MKILTLNTWGAPYAQHRAVRRQLISDKIKQLDPDIILLQEAYLPDCPRDFINRLADRWQYHHYFKSALVGSGLLTLARYPIVKIAFQPYRLAGKPEKILHGDFYAGKGIGLTRLDTPQGLLDVYNMHTHAQYDYKNHDNEYAVFNETNCYDAAKFIWEQSSHEYPVLIGGDINTSPDQRGYAILTELGQLGDAYPAIHSKHDVTFAADNPYNQHDNQTLDYLMGRKVVVHDIQLVMTEQLSGDALAYSDHHGLFADISLTDILPPSQDVNLRTILMKLQKRLDIAIAETENDSIKRYEKAVVGAFGLVDIAVTTGVIGRWNESLARLLRRIGFLFAILFAGYQVAQVQVNLKVRKQTLESIQEDISKHLADDQLFDGRVLTD